MKGLFNAAMHAKRLLIDTVLKHFKDDPLWARLTALLLVLVTSHVVLFGTLFMMGAGQ